MPQVRRQVHPDLHRAAHRERQPVHQVRQLVGLQRVDRLPVGTAKLVELVAALSRGPRLLLNLALSDRHSGASRGGGPGTTAKVACHDET